MQVTIVKIVVYCPILKRTKKLDICIFLDQICENRYFLQKIPIFGNEVNWTQENEFLFNVWFTLDSLDGWDSALSIGERIFHNGEVLITIMA